MTNFDIADQLIEDALEESGMAVSMASADYSYRHHSQQRDVKRSSGFPDTPKERKTQQFKKAHPTMWHMAHPFRTLAGE